MRIRFAPSPTGFLHIGNARTALTNYIVKKKMGATLVIRVEDTDMERSSRESEHSILSDLRWLGIDWDEGPDCGGDYGPYRQSERFDIYKEYTDKLLASGAAYHCYCTPEELESARSGAQQESQAYTYNGKCRNLSPEEISRFEAMGRKPTVRFRVPDGEHIVVDDSIKGKVIFESEHIGGDFIIVRSDGVPVYNYIVSIDDALMKITHVIRGSDHLPNTPKQLLIAKALGLPVPFYTHLTLILGPDRQKLSKRHGITSVDLYRKEGYLPEALINYLGMLGWASETGEEILGIDAICEQFDLANLGKSPSIFDFQKLRWINAQYIRRLPAETLTGLFLPYIEAAGYRPSDYDRGWLEQVIGLIGSSCEVLSDIAKHISVFLDETPDPDQEADLLLREADSVRVIQSAHGLMQSRITPSNYIADLVNAVKEDSGMKGKKLFHPMRAILTSRLYGRELDLVMPLLGYDKCKKRIAYIHERYAANANQ